MTVQIDGDDLVRGNDQRGIICERRAVVRQRDRCRRAVGSRIDVSLQSLPVGYRLGFGVGLAVELNACGVLRAYIGLGSLDIAIGHFIVIFELTGAVAVE